MMGSRAGSAKPEVEWCRYARLSTSSPHRVPMRTRAERPCEADEAALARHPESGGLGGCSCRSAGMSSRSPRRDRPPKRHPVSALASARRPCSAASPSSDVVRSAWSAPTRAGASAGACRDDAVPSPPASVSSGAGQPGVPGPDCAGSTPPACVCTPASSLHDVSEAARTVGSWAAGGPGAAHGRLSTPLVLPARLQSDTAAASGLPAGTLLDLCAALVKHGRGWRPSKRLRSGAGSTAAERGLLVNHAV